MDLCNDLLTFTCMKQILGVDIISNKLLVKSLPAGDESSTSKHIQSKSLLSTINRIAKGKFGLGAKFVQVGWVEKLFRQVFNVREGEELMKASKCCLFTTAGPVSGRLFISSDKLAFCSNKPILNFTSPSTQLLTFHYKVVIPLNKVKRANQCNNVKKPSQKYIQIVTTDDFEFWFMGFLRYKRTLKCLHQAVTQKLNQCRDEVKI